MSQTDTLYGYLKKIYSENEPIFLSDIDIKDMKPVYVRQQIKKLTEDGRIKRFDTGIYYLPKKTMFKSGSALSVDDVIRKKFLYDGNVQCGYLCGMFLANRLGLTTQVPATYEVCSNKATTEYRDTQLGSFRVILRKPYVEITEKNINALQFLDLMKEVVDISEIEGSELTDRLVNYLTAKGITFESLKPYVQFYPDRIYKNMYKVGLLNGLVT